MLPPDKNVYTIFPFLTNFFVKKERRLRRHTVEKTENLLYNKVASFVQKSTHLCMPYRNQKTVRKYSRNNLFYYT